MLRAISRARRVTRRLTINAKGRFDPRRLEDGVFFLRDSSDKFERGAWAKGTALAASFLILTFRILIL